MGITDGKIFFCHGILERKKDKIISMRKYSNRGVYECFSNNSAADCGKFLNLPPIPIDKSPRPK